MTKQTGMAISEAIMCEAILLKFHYRDEFNGLWYPAVHEELYCDGELVAHALHEMDGKFRGFVTQEYAASVAQCMADAIAAGYEGHNDVQ